MLEEKIFNEYKAALKSKDTIKSATLNFLRAQILRAAIDKKKKSLDDEEVVAIIKKQIKQHQESIEQFKKGNRQDLADKETRESEILKSYLPPQLADDDIKKTVEEVIAAVDAQGLKDMGRVMKEVMEKIGSCADGKLVSDLVKERLSKTQ